MKNYDWDLGRITQASRDVKDESLKVIVLQRLVALFALPVKEGSYERNQPIISPKNSIVHLEDFRLRPKSLTRPWSFLIIVCYNNEESQKPFGLFNNHLMWGLSYDMSHWKHFRQKWFFFRLYWPTKNRDKKGKDAQKLQKINISHLCLNVWKDLKNLTVSCFFGRSRTFS